MAGVKGAFICLMTVALSRFPSFTRFSLPLTLVSGNMCFRAGLEIHSKAGSQRALWVTEMERTETEHKEKREWKLSPLALSLSHSLLLSFNFPPTWVQWNTLESVQTDWWLTEVSWCLWTFYSRKFKRYVAAGSMAWFRCGHVSAGIFMEWLRVFSGMSWCLRLDWDFPCVVSADFLLSQEPFKSQTWENIHVTAVLGAAAAKMSLLSAQRWCVSLRYIQSLSRPLLPFIFSPV